MSNIRIAELAAERERDRISYLREIENSKTQERERIIKLLEEHLLAIDIFGETYCWICESGPYKGHLIALIKGEK